MDSTVKYSSGNTECFLIVKKREREREREYSQKCIFKFFNYINETSSSELEYLLGSLLFLLNLFLKLLFESAFAVFLIFISVFFC